MKQPGQPQTDVGKAGHAGKDGVHINFVSRFVSRWQEAPHKMALSFAEGQQNRVLTYRQLAAEAAFWQAYWQPCTQPLHCMARHYTAPSAATSRPPPAEKRPPRA